jgi:hypothetical protein
MINERDPFKGFEFSGAGKLATIEVWKERDEMVEKAIWSLASESESDVPVNEVCSVWSPWTFAAPSAAKVHLERHARPVGNAAFVDAPRLVAGGQAIVRTGCLVFGKLVCATTRALVCVCKCALTHYKVLDVTGVSRGLSLH